MTATFRDDGRDWQIDALRAAVTQPDVGRRLAVLAELDPKLARFLSALLSKRGALPYAEGALFADWIGEG